jgi:hypothetical protein
MTFLRTAHQQSADTIDLLVDLARAPNPEIITGLTLRPPSAPADHTQISGPHQTIHPKSLKRPPVFKYPCSGRVKSSSLLATSCRSVKPRSSGHFNERTYREALHSLICYQDKRSIVASIECSSYLRPMVVSSSPNAPRWFLGSAFENRRELGCCLGFLPVGHEGIEPPTSSASWGPTLCGAVWCARGSEQGVNSPRVCGCVRSTAAP